MKRSFVIAFAILVQVLFSYSFAQRLSGLRITSEEFPIVVCIDGREISLPSHSCFVANLDRGTYYVEVYRISSIGTRLGRVYSRNVHYNGTKTIDIFINSHGFYEKPPRKKERDRHRWNWGKGMSSEQFEDFYERYQKATFNSEKEKLLDYVLSNSGLYSSQARRLVKVCTFESDKKKMIEKVYPYIIDEENFYQVVEELSFYSDREEMYEKLKNMEEEERW